MSVDHSQPDTLVLSSPWLLKPSHRTRPEQIVGLLILLSVSFGFALVPPFNPISLGDQKLAAR